MLQVIDCSMVFTFSKQVEGILVLLREFIPVACDAMLLLIMYEFFFFHLPLGESGVIAGLDISDLSFIVAIVNDIIIKPLEFNYSIIRFYPSSI